MTDEIPLFSDENPFLFFKFLFYIELRLNLNAYYISIRRFFVDNSLSVIKTCSF